MREKGSNISIGSCWEMDILNEYEVILQFKTQSRNEMNENRSCNRMDNYYD